MMFWFSTKVARDLMFSTPFNKTNDYKCTNSLLEIGSTVDIDPVKNVDREKPTTNLEDQSKPS